MTQVPVDVEVVVAGRYRRDFLLGQGGMGTVWAATDLVLHRWVALKSLDLVPGSTAAAAAEQILGEAKAAAHLNHPGVVTVHDVVEVDGGLLLVTEYLAGGTLAANVRRDGPLDLATVTALGARLAGGLAAAHAAGVVHADVNPANVLLIGPDPTEAKLGDFGLATVRGTPVLAAGSSLGTPAYLAPERIAGCDPAEPADVYALGATLWFALTGRSPFERATVEATLEAAVAEALPPIGLDGPVVDLVVRALDRNPLRRPTATELVAGLAGSAPSPLPRFDPPAVAPPPVVPVVPVAAALVARAIDETTTITSLARASAPSSPEAPPRRRRRVVVGLACVLLGLALVAAGLRAGAGGDGPDRDGDEAAADDPGDRGDDPAPADADADPAEPAPDVDPAPAEDEAPAPSAPPAQPASPAEAAAYVDPQGGFEVVFPEGLAIELDGGAHVTEATAGDLRIAVRWFDDPLDPASFIAAEEERLTDFPGYERLALDGDGDDLVWTFTFAQPSAPDRLLHSTGRAFVVDGRTYAVFVRAADPAQVESVLAGITDTFIATP